MTAKEKAVELTKVFYFICAKYTDEIQVSLQANECAIACCNAIIDCGGSIYAGKLADGSIANGTLFWIEVREEIRKL